MNRSSFIWLLAAMLTIRTASAAEPGPAKPSITSRGPHHRVWSYPDGLGSYTELRTGMHAWRNGQWVEARQTLEIVPGAAIARDAANPVTFLANVNEVGSVQLEAPDGMKFRARVLGIALFDSASGQCVLIGETRDANGQVIGENQVLYPDAFETLSDASLEADARYTVRPDGLEQDVIFRKRPVTPEVIIALGFSPATTYIQIWTEFFGAENPARKTAVIRGERNAAARARMAHPDFIDESLDFGALQVGSGTAFVIGVAEAEAQPDLLVGKEWVTTDDARSFLVESVSYEELKPLLDTLPLEVAQRNEGAAPQTPKVISSKHFAQGLPVAPSAGSLTHRNFQLAKLERERPGVLIDWVLMTSSTDVTLRAGETYFVDGAVNLSGTTIIEGASVCKFTNAFTGGTARLNFMGPVLFKTDPHNPAIFTGCDDDTVGATITGSSGTPTNYYGDAYLNLTFGAGTTGGLHIKNAILRYPNVGVHMPQAREISLENVRIVKGDFGLFNKEVAVLRNVLISETFRPFAGQFTNAVTRAEHVTIHRADRLIHGDTLPAILMTNSLLISVTNNVRFVGSHVETNLSDSGIFEALGAGRYYLPAASPYRDAGTALVSSSMAAILNETTTTAPLLLTNAITMERELPQERGHSASSESLCPL